MGRPKKIFSSADPLAIAPLLPADEKEYYLKNINELNQNYPEQGAQALKSQSAYLALQCYRLMKEHEGCIYKRERRRRRLERISELIQRAEKFADVLIKDYKMPKPVPTPAQDAALFLGNMKRQSIEPEQAGDDGDLDVFEKVFNFYESDEGKKLIEEGYEKQK